MSRALLQELETRAADIGLNLVGLADCAEFDLCQPRGRRAREFLPNCQTIVVLGSGGSEFWRRLPRQDPRCDGADPVGARTVAFTKEVVAWLAAQGVAARTVYPDACRTLNFAQLGESAGLGTMSPVSGFLLHPTFGPWLSVRAAVLVAGYPFGCNFMPRVPASFQPCLQCAKPCVPACPIQVCDGDGGIDLRACATHRHGGGCTDHCAVRRACPVGTEQRYGVDEEAVRHQRGLRLLRRSFGLGWWRLVPKRWRRN